MASSTVVREAGIAVFSTNELLELIMLQLAPADILVVQRVNSAWHHTFRQCPVLQRKVNVPPPDAGCTPESACRKPNCCEYLNPLFHKKHPVWSNTERFPWHLESVEPPLQYYNKAEENNAILKKNPFIRIFLNFTLNDKHSTRPKPVKLYDESSRTGSWRSILL
ncbi:hypothetical protein BAUCODRAFT_147525 [Baudoinia panamericana UAMH 10762]|uniref:F-box domain-containing protein n=1 Tax=Baudoinia panamericana (strain UAMH 10762) TaxID=717646 RepID=M2N0J5_BAUPA|nr:uncharacterized protein BAUCODRAFT_147525 [Baudoinia panamericana UAMH 10762]EMC97443.1 hypothetical protein BAUCODRAFT_147525 [Baudoinia panamericana UAMH 10762]